MDPILNLILLLSPLILTTLAQGVVPTPACFKCNSTDNPNCAADRDPDIDYDISNYLRDRCVTAILNGITYRGFEKELKLPNDTLMETCEDDYCNWGIFPKDRLLCYQCKGKQCVNYNDYKNTLKVCVNYNKNDFCVTDVIDENNVVRGCFSDPNYKVNDFTSVCVTSGCNKKPAVTNVECIVCSQTNGTSCVRRPEPVQAFHNCEIQEKQTCKTKVLLNHPACFTYNQPNGVVRGCIENADEFDFDNTNFQKCSGDLCNNRCLPIKCIKCDSKKEPKCANQAAELKVEQCESETHCKTATASDGTLVRQCGGYLEGDICFEDGCNKKMYTPTMDIRKNLHCYQCYDEKNCPKYYLDDKPMPCKLPTDGCFQYLNNQDEMVRGCKSDKEFLDCLTQGEKCYKCSSPGCNNRPSWRWSNSFINPAIECFECQENDHDCPFPSNKLNILTCHPYAPYYKEDFTCYTCLKINGTVERGCISHLDKSAYQCEKYETCNTDKCNGKSFVTQNCIQCEGDEGICNKDVTGTPCNVTLTYSTAGCYFKQIGDKFTRGCVSDFGGKQICGGDEKYCKICKGENCNTFSGVEKLSVAFEVIFALIIFYLSI